MGTIHWITGIGINPSRIVLRGEAMKYRLYAFFRKLRLRFFPPKPLLTEQEHKELLEKFRRFEDIEDKVCTLLKCQPKEMHLKINKLCNSIDEMGDYLRTTYVGKLIDLTHKRCKKHEGPSCKQCDKCLDFECEKCHAIDWLRNDLGLPPLLNKNKCALGPFTNS